MSLVSVRSWSRLRAEAWAINPCDGILQSTALPFVKYPVIPGQDVAGTVEVIAPESTAASKFKIGDASTAEGLTKSSRQSTLLRPDVSD